MSDKPELTLKNLGKLIIISYRLTKSTRMAALIETVKTVSSLLPTYDGSPNKLQNFLDALGIVKQIAPDNQLPTVINIILTKLEGRARHAFPQAPATIDNIIATLKNVSAPVPPEAIIAKLANCKQRTNITEYTEEIEKLTMQLEAAYISKQIPAQVAQTMATKEGVKHMTAGLKDEKNSILVKAGQYTNISEAINKALEESPQMSNEVNVQFATAHNKHNQPRFQQSNYHNCRNNHNQRGNRYNGRYQNARYYHNDRSQRDNTYNRGNHERRGNFNNIQRFGNNQFRGSRGRNSN